jgi:hypothetical protein
MNNTKEMARKLNPKISEMVNDLWKKNVGFKNNSMT